MHAPVRVERPAGPHAGSYLTHKSLPPLPASARQAVADRLVEQCQPTWHLELGASDRLGVRAQARQFPLSPFPASCPRCSRRSAQRVLAQGLRRRKVGPRFARKAVH